MSKYDGLEGYLRRLPQQRMTLRFDEIEDVIGARLPSSAHRHIAWWANQSGGRHPQSAAWLRAGWRVQVVDVELGCVTFSRLARSPAQPTTRLRLAY